MRRPQPRLGLPHAAKRTPNTSPTSTARPRRLPGHHALLTTPLILGWTPTVARYSYCKAGRGSR